MTDSEFCWDCWWKQHESRECDEAGEARLLAALEDLPFSAPVYDADYVDGLAEFAESIADGLESGDIVIGDEPGEGGLT